MSKMIEITIPGRVKMVIENIVFDFNGTLAVDGKVSETIREKIMEINEFLNVFILTADIYGSVYKQCKNLGVSIKTFARENTGIEKRKIVEQIGYLNTITIGNGVNDIPMMKDSILSIGVIGKEGACGKLLTSSDIIANDIMDVFDMINNKDRISATLRG